MTRDGKRCTSKVTNYGWRTRPAGVLPRVITEQLDEAGAGAARGRGDRVAEPDHPSLRGRARGVVGRGGPAGGGCVRTREQPGREEP